LNEKPKTTDLRVVHISTVHKSGDPRIRLKELQSLSEAGYSVYFVTTDRCVRNIGENDPVKFVFVGGGKPNRIIRILFLVPLAVLRALFLPAHIYHFHDPELLMWAWILRLRRVPIIYDIHEDNSLAVYHRPWIPPRLAPLLSGLVDRFERWASRRLSLVVAETCYLSRFPQALPVLNYPSVDLVTPQLGFSDQSTRVLYTGNLTPSRGAYNLAALVRDSSYTVVSVGQCSAELASNLRLMVGNNRSRLQIRGEERYVPFSEIQATYQQGGWLAGVVLIPDTSHYRDKHLTKFFEFMAAGLPIVATNVPEWKKLIQDQGLGLCVQPNDSFEVARALRWLQEHPVEARDMGKRGQLFVREKYNWESQARLLLQHYAKILS